MMPAFLDSDLAEFLFRLPLSPLGSRLRVGINGIVELVVVEFIDFVSFSNSSRPSIPRPFLLAWLKFVPGFVIPSLNLETEFEVGLVPLSPGLLSFNELLLLSLASSLGSLLLITITYTEAIR